MKVLWKLIVFAILPVDVICQTGNNEQKSVILNQRDEFSPLDLAVTREESSGPFPVYRDKKSDEPKQPLGSQSKSDTDSNVETASPQNIQNAKDNEESSSKPLSINSPASKDEALDTEGKPSVVKPAASINRSGSESKETDSIDGTFSINQLESAQSQPSTSFLSSTDQLPNLGPGRNSGQGSIVSNKANVPVSSSNDLGSKGGPSTTGSEKNAFLDFQPRGNLYVSVQNPVQVGSVAACSFPEQFDEDPFQLSTSEFGYPNSIVEQALRNSVAETVLKTLINIRYNGILATQARGGSVYGPANLGTNGLDNSYAFSQSPPSLNSKFNTVANTNLNNGASENFGDSGFGTLETSLGNPAFGTLSSFGKGIGTLGAYPIGSSTTARRQNPESKPDDRKRSDDTTENQPGVTVTTKPIDSSETRAETAADKSNNAREETVPVDNTNHDNTAVKVNPKFRAPYTDVGNFNSFSANSLPSDPTSTNKNLFGSVSIDQLFPPKRSDHFLDEPPSPVGEDQKSPFITYNSGRTGQTVSSPFTFNSKSLFGSLSGSPFGLTGSRTSSQNRNDQQATSPFGSSGFSSGSSLFSPQAGNQFSSLGSQGFGNKNSQFGFLQSFRRKRQAEFNPVVSVTSACKSTYKVLRQYKNHEGICFVVMPEAQGIYYAECSNAPCSGCGFDGGTSRCMADRVPVWVWSYCEGGPYAGKVMPDRVQVSVTCTCKTATCQGSIPGG